jgi:hypothetical protein
MLFPLKRSTQREKNTSNMAATVGVVMDDVTCKCSIQEEQANSFASF